MIPDLCFWWTVGLPEPGAWAPIVVPHPAGLPGVFKTLRWPFLDLRSQERGVHLSVP